MKNKKPHVIAFYLPQFHPVKENNEWFGEGFTEWTNVGKTKPLFKGHYQPRVPADLGYYDLRISEVREKQAELAKEAGITAFCYYHYWFGYGKQMLQTPIREVIKSGQPDFPFCLCWANHTWYKKNWNIDTNTLEQNILLEQEYPGETDIIEHFNSLISIFRDERYLKIRGRLLFVIYNVKELPDFDKFRDIWNKLAIKSGLPEFYFVGYTTLINEPYEVPFNKLDGVVLSLLNNIIYRKNPTKWMKLKTLLKEKISELTQKPRLVFKYSEAMKFLLHPIEKDNRIFPVIVPNWDYTPRRKSGGLILVDSTPELFKQHVIEALDLISEKPIDDQILFLKSWNEWGEGNYMEPDLKFGKGYIYALREALSEYYR